MSFQESEGERENIEGRNPHEGYGKAPGEAFRKGQPHPHTRKRARPEGDEKERKIRHGVPVVAQQAGNPHGEHFRGEAVRPRVPLFDQSSVFSQSYVQEIEGVVDGKNEPTRHERPS